MKLLTTKRGHSTPIPYVRRIGSAAGPTTQCRYQSGRTCFYPRILQRTFLPCLATPWSDSFRTRAGTYLRRSTSSREYAKQNLKSLSSSTRQSDVKGTLLEQTMRASAASLIACLWALRRVWSTWLLFRLFCAGSRLSYHHKRVVDRQLQQSRRNSSPTKKKKKNLTRKKCRCRRIQSAKIVKQWASQ